MYAWNQLGRRVNKGQKGIRILAPMIGIRKKKDSEAEKDITKQNQPVLVGFRTAYVFDVSRPRAHELPDIAERVKGEVGEYRERLIDFIIAQGIELEFKESIAPALGMSYGGKIAILPGQSAAEEFGTFVHEASHELLHKCGSQDRYHQDRSRDGGRGNRLRRLADHRPRRWKRLSRLHPPVPRQRRTSGRELGSHSAHVSLDSFRHRDTRRHSGADRGRSRPRTRTGASQLTNSSPREGGRLRPSRSNHPARPNPPKEGSHAK